MTDIETLRRDADRCANSFADEIAVASPRLKPSRIVDDMIGKVKAQITLPRMLKTGLGRVPLLAISGLAGAWLLARQVTKRNRANVPGTTRQIRRTRPTQ